MSYETMQECIKMIDFDLAMKSYQEGKKLCEDEEEGHLMIIDYDISVVALVFIGEETHLNENLIVK